MSYWGTYSAPGEFYDANHFTDDQWQQAINDINHGNAGQFMPGDANPAPRNDINNNLAYHMQGPDTETGRHALGEQANAQFAPLFYNEWDALWPGNGDLNVLPRDSVDLPLPIYGYVAGQVLDYYHAIQAIQAGYVVQELNGSWIVQSSDTNSTAQPLNRDNAVQPSDGGYVSEYVDGEVPVEPAAQSINNDSAAQSVDNDLQEGQPAQLTNNNIISPITNNEVSRDSTAEPPSYEAADPSRSNEDAQNNLQGEFADEFFDDGATISVLSDDEGHEAMQDESADHPVDSEMPEETDVQKHNRYLDEYFGYQDSDDESSEEENDYDLLNLNLPSIGQPCTQDISREQFSNIKSKYTVHSALASIRDPVQHGVDTVRNRFNPTKQGFSAGGNASHPIVVADDDDDVSVQGGSQQHQHLSEDRFAIEPTLQGPDAIQYHPIIPIPKKRVDRSDPNDEEDVAPCSPKCCKTTGPDMVSTQERRDIAKPPRVLLKPVDAVQNQSMQQSIGLPLQALTPTLAPSAYTLQQGNPTQPPQANVNQLIPHNWAPLQIDDTIPRKSEDRAYYINLMVAAIKDTAQCIDSQNVASFQARWAKLNTPYSASTITKKEIDAAAVEMLKLAETLHANGPAGFQMRIAAKLKIISKYRHLKFAQRINQICDLLRLSKARCDKILRFDNLEMVVGAPEHIIKETKSNRKHNQTRQKHIQTTQTTQTQPQVVQQETGQEHDGGENQPLQQLQHKEATRRPNTKFQVYRDDVQDHDESQADSIPARVFQPSARQFNPLLRSFEDGPPKALLSDDDLPQDIVDGPQQDLNAGFAQGSNAGFQQDFINGRSHGFLGDPTQGSNAGPLHGLRPAPSQFVGPVPSQVSNPPRSSLPENVPLGNADPALLSVSSGEQREAAQSVTAALSQTSAIGLHNKKRKPFEPLPRSAYLPVAAPQPPAPRQQNEKRKPFEPLPRSAYLPATPTQSSRAEKQNVKRRRFEPLASSAYLPVSPSHSVRQPQQQQPQAQPQEQQQGQHQPQHQQFQHQPQYQLQHQWEQQEQHQGQQQHLADPPNFTGDREFDQRLHQFFIQANQDAIQQDQEHQLIAQQQQPPPGSISYGGHMWAPAGTISTGVMPLAPNVSAQNRPLQGQKRGRGVEVDAEGPYGSPPKRRNLGRRK